MGRCGPVSNGESLKVFESGLYHIHDKENPTENAPRENGEGGIWDWDIS